MVAHFKRKYEIYINYMPTRLLYLFEALIIIVFMIEPTTRFQCKLNKQSL